MIDRPGKTGVPQAISTTEDSITLGWDPPHLDGGSPVVGYFVVKREAGTKKWNKLVLIN